MGPADKKVRVQEKTVSFKSILNTFLQGAQSSQLDLDMHSQVVQLSLVEVKDKDSEKFLISMTTGEEEQVHQGANSRGTIIDELQSAGGKDQTDLDLEGTYGKINEIMINRLIHFEQSRILKMQ